MARSGRELEIVSVEARSLDVPLLAPFVIASSRLEAVRNVAVRVRLAGGATGYGEAATLPPVTLETQPSALAAIEEAAAWLAGRDAGSWRGLAVELEERMPDLLAARAGIEMAILDAFARHHHVPLYRLFGGATDRAVTDITIPICPAEEAGALAARYRDAGFTTIKSKVGLDLDEDVGCLRAIRAAHPTCALVLDANEGYTAEQALQLVRALRDAGITPALLEQPVPRDDWDGLGRVSREAGVPVAADESCRTPADALRIAHERLAQVLNIKLAKCGVVGGLEIAAIARGAGLGAMIGEMVETRLATGFAAHFAAGLGGFDFVDLDTPLLMAEDPIDGGPTVHRAEYRLDGGESGHGARVRGW